MKAKRSPKELRESHKGCRFKCEEKLNEEDRKVICSEYWALGDFGRQRDYLLNSVDEKKVEKKSKGAVRPKSISREYHLRLNDERHRVCQYFFHETLSISKNHQFTL